MDVPHIQVSLDGMTTVVEVILSDLPEEQSRRSGTPGLSLNDSIDEPIAKQRWCRGTHLGDEMLSRSLVHTIWSGVGGWCKVELFDGRNEDLAENTWSFRNKEASKVELLDGL